MTSPAGRTEACWPSANQELLLRACFLPAPEAGRAFDAWRASVDPARLEDFSIRLLPILARRWGDDPRDPRDPEIAELGARIRLAQWRQNLQRLELAAAIQGALREAAIECLFLKGIALWRHYGDPGLRGMGDIDFLVRPEDAGRAFVALTRTGWIAEGGLPVSELAGQMRVRHAWQFDRGAEESSDLHWRPVVRCYAPEVAERFSITAERVEIGGHSIRIPGASEQLFHVCAHGLQWSWTPQTRWVPDAMMILTGGMSGAAADLDWPGIAKLAIAANMTVRLHDALRYLRAELDAAIPETAIAALGEHPAPDWERREQRLLQRPAPLGPLDSARWHVAHFRRIRPYDPEWKAQAFATGLVSYLRIFLRMGQGGSLAASLGREFRRRWR